MITIMPHSLTPYNIPSLAKRAELVQPVSQIGRLAVSDDYVFELADTALNKPGFLAVLEQAAVEGFPIRLVVGGGRDLAERQAAAVWAFAPLLAVSKVSVDELLDLGKEQQRLATSHSAPVAPTRKGFDRFKGRSGAKPVIKMVNPDNPDDAAVDDEGVAEDEGEN